MGVLMALLLPAIASCREVARRAECAQHLTKLAMAMHQYEAANLFFPAAGWTGEASITHEPAGKHQSWTIGLLPFLDRQDVYRQFKPESSIYDQDHAEIRSMKISTLTCPSDVSGKLLKLPASSYAGCYHPVEAPIAANSQGALVINKPLRREEYPDGLAHVLMLGEKQSDTADLGWLSATRSTLRNTGHPLNAKIDKQAVLPSTAVGGFGGPHVGGCWLVMGDGTVKFVSDQLATDVLERLGNRSDGVLVSDDRF